MALPFTAHCARDHERVDFTDRAEFERHMIGTHKARKPSHGKLTKPRPWKAPKAPADTAKLTAVLVKADAGGYDIAGGRGVRSVLVRDYDPEWSTPDRVTVDALEPGTTFVCMGRTYDLHGIDFTEGSIDVSMRPEPGRAGRPGADRKRIPLSSLVKLADKGDGTVAIVGRFSTDKAVAPAA